jgi:hypothetical protein
MVAKFSSKTSLLKTFFRFFEPFMRVWLQRLTNGFSERKNALSKILYVFDADPLKKRAKMHAKKVINR